MTAYTLAYVAAARTLVPASLHAQLDAAAARLLQRGEACDSDDAMIQACIDAVLLAASERGAITSPAFDVPLRIVCSPAANDALGELCDAVCNELNKSR